MTGGVSELVIQLSPIKPWSKGTLAVILVLLSGLATDRTLADSDKSSAATSLFDSRVTLAVGGFFPRVRSTLTLSAPDEQGTEISAEDDLGLDNGTNSAWVSFNWRFKPRHQLQVEWFELDRKGSAQSGGGNAEFDYEFFGPAIFGYANF